MFLSLGSILEEKWRQVICELALSRVATYIQEKTFWKPILVAAGRKEKPYARRATYVVQHAERRTEPTNTFSGGDIRLSVIANVAGEA